MLVEGLERIGQVAEDAYLSRHSTVKAGLPVGTPAMNVNRICGWTDSCCLRD